MHLYQYVHPYFYQLNNTPLYDAVLHGYVEIVDLLISKRASVNAHCKVRLQVFMYIISYITILLKISQSEMTSVYIYIYIYIPVRSNHHPLFKYQNPKQTQSVDKVYYNTRV